MARGWGAWPARPWPIHPFLFAVGPIVVYLNDNYRMAEWTQALSPLGVVWSVVALWLLGATLRIPPRKAGLVASIAILAWFAKVSDTQEPWVLAGALVAIGLVLAWRGTLDITTTLLNVTAALSLVMPIREWVLWEMRDKSPRTRPEAWETPALPDPTGELPDIWYIVLDGYGRADVLAERYGMGDGLSGALEEKGFYVARRSYANYVQTNLSLASSLNFDTFDKLLYPDDRGSSWRRPLVELIRDSRLVRVLRAAGYRVADWPGEYSPTDLPGADEVHAPFPRFTEFGYGLLNASALPWIQRQLTGYRGTFSYAVRRRQIRWTLDHLGTTADDGSPTFHFVHIVAPHPPFVFEADGAPRPSTATASFSDGSSWDIRNRGKESYRDGYAAQTAFLDRELAQAIDRILAHSTRRPVILVQGDHGPGEDLDWGAIARTDLKERLAILNAYYLPDPTPLHPSISPVNSFRVVLNEVLGASLPLLPDRSWYCEWYKTYGFTEVTEFLDPVPPTRMSVPLGESTLAVTLTDPYTKGVPVLVVPSGVADDEAWFDRLRGWNRVVVRWDAPANPEEGPAAIEAVRVAIGAKRVALVARGAAADVALMYAESHAKFVASLSVADTSASSTFAGPLQFRRATGDPGKAKLAKRFPNAKLQTADITGDPWTDAWRLVDFITKPSAAR